MRILSFWLGLLSLCFGNCKAGFIITPCGQAAVSHSFGVRNGQRSVHWRRQVLPLSTSVHPSLRTRTNNTAHAVAMLRGGGGAVASYVSLTLLAKIFSALTALKGSALVVAPKTVGRKVFGVDAGEETFPVYLVQAIGAIAVGIGINLSLAVLGKVSVQQAMGFGLLPRLLFVLKSFLLGTFDELGFKKRFLSVNTLVMSWCIFSLLTGKGSPVVAAKVFSSMALLKAVFLILRPANASENFFGVDVGAEGMEKEKALCRSLGVSLSVSAVLMGALAFDIEPVKAAGYASLVWSLLLFDHAFLSKTYKITGGGPWPERLMFAIMTLFAVGFLA